MNNPPAEGPRLAVITVSHNSMQALTGWLAAIEASGLRNRLQLCIVDSGSSPEQLAEMDAEIAGRVDALLKLPNVGFGAACNAGAAHTEAPILLFTNPDAELIALPERALEGDIGNDLIGSIRIEPDRSGGYASFPTLRDEVQKLAVGAWSRRYVRSYESPAWVTGAALMIGRRQFERIGGFSPDYFMYFEDADLCARHREAGGQVLVTPEFVVRHGHGESSAEDRRDSLMAPLDSLNRLSARRFASRHGRRWHGTLLYLVLVLAYVPRRALLLLIRDRRPFSEVVDYVACLLAPRRALRRLGAASADTKP